MRAKILSLNIGHPAPMEWNGRSVISSMKKSSVPGPLLVHRDRIEGNSFSQPQYHGTMDSVLYAFGLPSAQKFMDHLGEGIYTPGMTGETLTLDTLDETEISVGDIFRFGTVIAQATYPRIPCGKVNFRMQHPQGQRAMKECGYSGVYFRILTPGEIKASDTAERTESAVHRFTIFDLYGRLMRKEKASPEEIDRIEANGTMPEHILAALL